MALNLDAVGTVLGPAEFEYNEDDVILYAIGVGVEPDELEFVYENMLKVLPTFAVIPARGPALNTAKLVEIDYTKLLHGENRIEVYKPLPPHAKFTATATVKAIYDKGKGAVVVTELEAKDELGDLLYKNISSAFVRGAGGWGGERGPSGPKNVPPDREPDAVVSMTTRKDQAHLYRLCGDKNLLHIDPEFAKSSGFEEPILHGLCTYGHVGRAVLKTYCDNEPAKMKAFEVRFSGVVYPGDTITTEMWKVADDKIILRAKTDDDNIVISGAAVELNV
ncbi:MAG: MaoC family dehydratase N-terminal domain-containing protein [Candidatus Hydrogenedentes bacterium]|nr:MaoC family dehydratase N-terminal domain-containing protein [Candidatus Hydrogenedentota bacterium]